MANEEHEFIILVNGQLHTYTQYEDIPLVIDNVISFKPYIPTGPHTPEQHATAEQWTVRLKDLMKRETR